MIKYESSDKPAKMTAAVKPDKTSSLEKKIEEQAKEINALQREVRKLKNELRSAVNAFNLKSK